MSTIYFNSAVARHCGNNGIIKAVLLQYIYNYHRSNPRKGAGTPASIKLTEFVYRYTSQEKPLWKRSFIHKILKDLETDKHLIITRDGIMPVYSVSAEVAALLNAKRPELYAFDLATACTMGIHYAIISRHLLHIIDCSQKKVAYALDIPAIADASMVSAAQIYRIVDTMVAQNMVRKLASPLHYRKRGMNLCRFR
jgi:hypothetical protein